MTEDVERIGAAMLRASRQFERDVRFNELTDDEIRILARAALSAMPGWLPISEARKDRTVIWAAFHPRIYPVLEPGRPDLERWNGVQIAIKHPGAFDDGFDIGWNIAAPVGHGGFPDRWIVGWQPLPPPPEQTDDR
jgi:hypothetical protein